MNRCDTAKIPHYTAKMVLNTAKITHDTAKTSLDTAKISTLTAKLNHSPKADHNINNGIDQC
ncbi:hypothetical protein [Alkalibacillus almallahensis]|uniref:hypothetical protein n=1 Tax=Alkalibacillus almallahensis TaxID=1379154 RepID=UPI00141DF3A9|nr:hypothetical protein [Alkalibacillus almallahensis]NIK12456.1 hypothetical protein [Alkalibacillus almallahensis]